MPKACNVSHTNVLLVVSDTTPFHGNKQKENEQLLANVSQMAGKNPVFTKKKMIYGQI